MHRGHQCDEGLGVLASLTLSPPALLLHALCFPALRPVYACLRRLFVLCDCGRTRSSATTSKQNKQTQLAELPPASVPPAEVEAAPPLADVPPASGPHAGAEAAAPKTREGEPPAEGMPALKRPPRSKEAPAAAGHVLDEASRNILLRLAEGSFLQCPRASGTT